MTTRIFVLLRVNLKSKLGKVYSKHLIKLSYSRCPYLFLQVD